MDGFVSPEVLAELRQSAETRAASKSRLRINFDGSEFAVLDLKDDGFTLAEGAPAHMRGLVDLFDGSRHISQCLVVQSEVENGCVRYEFKRNTEARTTPVADYVVDPFRPAGYLTYDARG